MQFNLFKYPPIVVSIILIFLITGKSVQAQSINTGQYQYLSPVPGAKMIMPSTGIIIRYGTSYSPADEKSINSIIVKGDKSGIHKGRLLLLEDNNTLTFKPYAPFKPGEKVTVELSKIRLTNNAYTPYLKYSFTITNKVLHHKFNAAEYLGSEFPVKKANENEIDAPVILQDSLPADFPGYTVSQVNPAAGYLFFAPFSWPPINPVYIIISDNYGTPVFYRQMPSTIFDFQKQPNGNLTYFDTNTGIYYEMNSKYQIINTFNMQNGYSTDVHEIRILDNGHVLMFSYDPQVVGMDTVVAGGNHHAIVTGLILQEQDNSNNVVFEWRSWDHFKITDAAEDIILTDSLIDYVHGNAIEVDYDGNLLISSRHMDEISKIDRTTGDIIWRWGGIHCKNNEFTFVNDPSGFSHQHCIRRLPNGNYTIFDNGNLHSPLYSRATEYQLDEENKIAALVWEYKNAPTTYSGAMGSVQRLANHNTIIGWGTNNAPPGIKEVGVDGSLQLSFTFSDTTFCYRAFKHDWDSGVFTSDKDHLSFGIVPAGQSATLSFNLTNNYPETVEINSIFNRESAYTLQQQLPITLAPQNSVTLSVKFNPETEGAFVDDLHLRWETEGQRIAEVIHLNGYTDSTYLGIEGNIVPSEFFVDQNYPNPFNPITKIKYNLPHNSFVNLRVYDILGSEITTLVNAEQPSGNYEVEFNGADLASGIYFYRFDAGGFTSVKKMLLLK